MEEIYLSPDGLYEYSIAELQEAAKESKENFEEFISSRGFKLKGSEVEETVEVEEKEPLTPNDFKKQAEVNKINKIAESAKNFKLDETIIVDEPEPISFDDINADLMKSIVEDNKLVDLPTMSVINSPNFQSWINSESQKERSIKEEKTLDVLNQPDISNALITNNFTVENVNQLRNLGVKNLPEFPEGATGLLSDQAANNPFTSAGNYSPITSYNDLVDEALNDDEKIIPLFAKAQTEEVEQNRFNFFSNIVKQDNNNLKPEELENKVKGLEVENMIKTSDAQAKNFLGEELYNKWSLASTQEEKNKILKEKFGNVKNLIDEDGNLIRTKKSEYNNNSFLNQFLPSSLKPEEVKKVIDETKQELEAYTNTGVDQLFELYNSAANDVASFAKLLYAKGSEGIMDQALPTQKANEFLMNIGVPAEDGDKSLKDDFKNLEQIANTGVIPEDLSFLPRGGNKLVNDYNKALKKLQTIQTAIGLNTDLTKVKRQEGFDILGKETKNVFGFETLGINEMQNTLLYAFQDDLGIEAKEKEIAKMGLPGEIYVKQPDEEYFSGEKLLAQMPGFAKMGAEVYFSMGILGGAINLPKITAGVADLISINATRLGMGKGAATRFAQFAAGTFQESAGLIGSNTIGSNLTGSEKMPVIPFAVGSQLGHLGTNWLGEVMKKGLANTAKNNKYLGNVVNFFKRMPGGSTLGGAVKFGVRPALGAGAIKSGEFTSGVYDIVKENLGFGKADMDMSELWHHVTDADSFLETYGALMFMSTAHPSQMKVNAVKNFEYDMLKLKTNMPEWNMLAAEIGLEARGSKKGGRTSWSFFEIREAVDNKLNEISTNAELTPEQARDQIAQTKALGKRLGIKRVLDSELASADGKLNWNNTYKNLQLTLNSIKAGNSVDAKDIKNLTDAGFANGGATPILELQGLGFDEVTATNLVKHAETSYNEAQEFFATDSKNFESYIESGIVEMQNNGIKENLKKQYDSKNLSETAFKFKTEQAEKQIKIQQEKQRILIDLSRGDAKQRIKETSDYVDQVVGEGFDIRRLSNEKWVELKSELGEEQKSTSIGYGFQTTIDGKPTFVINKDAMLEGGVFRFESGGKTYRIGQGFKGSTEKHEVFHGVFENKFDARSVEARARELAGAEGDLDAARETIKRQDIEYIDSFIQRLKDVGIYNRVEAEMKLRPDYIELKKRGGRDIQIEKEFINEYLELQNEGKLNSLIEGVEFKNVNADVVTKLNNGADVVDYFAKGVEQTPEGKAKVKEALDNYKELVKEGDTPINFSEKNLKDLTKEYKENRISREDLGELIQQYTASGIAALKRIASIGKRKVPVDTKNPKITEGIADLLVLEFDSFTRNYDPAKAEVSTYMNKIAERILPKYVEKFKPNENVRIDDLTKEVADTKTPETDLVDKESEIKETERLVSVFEGKEAKAKQKEIIEVFEDLRSNPEKLEEARIKGFGGTPKEQLSKVAELLFNIPDGTKVSNPSKNVLPTINIVNSKGKKITKKQLDAGEKGIIDAKDFLSLRDYFKDKNNLRRFLNASLPEYNVNTPQSIINVKGENIQVSPDVVGRGIRLPDKIYDYFYEQFVDPTGVMTSPSGRGKGKTSQVPKVYKIKPEFRKPTNEVIDKVSKDILADVKLNDLPSEYNRTIAQLVKGMSLVETMAVSNQAKRTKLPAETAAEKQLIADIKSSSSKLSMSEKIKKGINADIEKLSGGALDKSNPKDFRKFEDNIIDKMTPILKEDIYSFITPSNIAAAGNEAFGSKPGRGAVGAGFFYITEFGTAKKPTAERTGETASMLEAGYIGEIRTLEKKIEEKYGYKKPRAKDRSYFAKTQGLKNYEYNLKNIKELNKQKSNLIDKLKEIVTKHPDASPTVKEFLYNQKANSSNTKNFALVTSRQKGATERNKYEEHPYQHGEFARDLTKAINSKVEGAYKNWKDYAGEEYYQTVFNKTTRIPSIRGDMRTYQGIVDLTYELPGYGTWKAQSQKYPLVNEMMDIAFESGKKSDWAKVPPAADMRYFNEVIKLNPFELTTQQNGKEVTYAEKYGLEVSEFLESNPAIYKAASDLIFQINLTKAGKLTGDSKMTSKKAQETLDEIIKVRGTKEADLAFKNNKSELDKPGVMNTSEKMTTEELVEKARTIDKALQMADRPNMPKKKIRIFDFDDTVARTNSKVFAEKEGERIELTAEEFAEKGIDLIDQGYEMDFTDFNKVVEGKKGPLFDLIKKLKEAPGERDLFILTARAPESQQAIFEFMKAMGVEIPLENITGLGKSDGEAKANWIIDKAAEGYNDFYFADDAPQNVKAVKTALDVIDVKSKVQQARLNTSEKMNTTFNEIIEQSTGIDAVKVFSDVKAQVRGGKKKGQKFFIPPSAEDFLGLLYTTLPKGKKGEKAMKFYQDALLDPYTRAMTNLSTSRVNLMSDFKALKKQLDVPKDLKKETESGFTNEQAVRVYLWNKVGEKIPGLSKTDLKELSDIVEKDPKLKVFADEILSITKGDGYSKPGEGWSNGTITTDLVDILNTTKRGRYLETWKENIDVVFSKDNLNKLEAAYGQKYREAVENSLSRMKKGSNRVAGGNRLSNQVLDYINNSTGVTMFINARSALLQTISAANFVNWSFNNPYQAGKAFANQPQFWKDFKQLINSDYLTDRRNGLKLNISESEIANAAKTSKNKAKAVLSYILEKGYAPTKYADSFAIAFGGASYYRNRVKDLMRNKGMSEAEANKQALIDWRAESEKSQQSSDPSKISAQQSSDLGRVVLQYVNTPMQYARMQKRDVQDIVNKRAMPGKTLAESNRVRVSRIIYYAAIQNLVFNALQQGLFSLGFGDSDISDDEQKKIVNAANGMLDSSLRGLGVGGVTIQVLKNLGIDIYRRSQKDRPEYVDAWIKLLEFSPAIKSKLGRFKSAAYPFDNKKKREEVFEKGFALNNPAYESGAKVITAVTNIPLDRVISKTNNLISAFDEDTEAWMSVAMILGWPEWQLQDKGNNKNNSEGSKNPFAIKKNKSKNPFAIDKKKSKNPFAVN